MPEDGCFPLPSPERIGGFVLETPPPSSGECVVTMGESEQATLIPWVGTVICCQPERG